MGIYGHRFDISLDEFMLKEGAFLDNLPDISPEIINKFCVQETLTEAYMDQVLTESVNTSQYLGKILVRMNISASKYMSLMNKAIKDIATTVKTKGVNKESREKIRSIINKLWVDLGDALPDTTDLIKDYGNSGLLVKFADLDQNKVTKSMILVLFSATVVGIVLPVLTILFGPTGTGIGATIMGPLLEENCKQIAIKGDFVKEYTMVFNTFEFSQYVLQIVGAGGPLGAAIKVRLLAVGMHLTTTLIQWLTNNPKVLEKLHIDGEDDKNKASIVGHTIGMIIHGVWNGLASFSQTFNNYLMKACGFIS